MVALIEKPKLVTWEAVNSVVDDQNYTYIYIYIYISDRHLTAPDRSQVKHMAQ